MPNPYHDEAGRFASRDEMAASVDRLEASGDREAWMELRIALADADAALAKSELAFHKAVTEFATNSNAGFPEGSSSFWRRSNESRDYKEVISAASSPEQLTAAWQAVKNGRAMNSYNAAAILNHPDVTPELEAGVFHNVSRQEYSSLAARLDNITPKRAHQFAFNGTPATAREVFKHLSEEDRVALMDRDPNYVSDYISQLGWNNGLASHAYEFAALSAQNPDHERYGYYGSVPAMRATQRFVRTEQLLAQDTDEAFDELLSGKSDIWDVTTDAADQGLLAAAGRATVTLTRGNEIIKRLRLHNFEAVRTAIRKNERVDGDVADRFAPEPNTYLLPGKPDAALKAEVAQAKSNMLSWTRRRGSYYSDTDFYAVDYVEAQARYDSYPSTFTALETKAARYEQDFIDDKIGKVALWRMQDRLKAAKRYQHLLGLKAQLNGTADQLVLIEDAAGAEPVLNAA